MELNDAGMIKLEEIVEFSIGALGIDEVLEGIDDLFDGYKQATSFVACLVDYSIRTFSCFLQDFVFPVDLIIKLFRLFHSEFYYKPSFKPQSPRSNCSF